MRTSPGTVSLHHRSLRRCRRRVQACGFTLAELLVAIAIIAIILAFSIPVVSTARKQSQNTQCLSNLRQLSSLVSSYLAENNQKMYADDRFKGLTDSRDGYWASAIRESLGMTVQGVPATGGVVNIVICPADPHKGGWKNLGAVNGVPTGANLAAEGIRLKSYLPNRYVLNYRITEFEEPSKIVMFTEFPWGITGTRSIWGDSANWNNLLPKDWHGGRINVLFMDFHIESVPVADLQPGGSRFAGWNSRYPSPAVAK